MEAKIKNIIQLLNICKTNTKRVYALQDVFNSNLTGEGVNETIKLLARIQDYLFQVDYNLILLNKILDLLEADTPTKEAISFVKHFKQQ